MADLLFELLCEELPPRVLRRAATALGDSIRKRLQDAGLPADDVAVLFTPRRLTVSATGLPSRSPDRQKRVKGPRLGSAFDADGAPTRAAEGFARKHGLTPDALERDDDNVVAVVRTAGRDAGEVVAEILPAAVADVPWKKRMRWGAPDVFARPIRGVVALLDADVVPCEIAGLAAGRTTRGHAFLAPHPLELRNASASAYVNELRAAHVMADPAERETGVREAATAAAGRVDIRPALLEEVVNLVEWPSALVGHFDPSYLELPPRLLVTVMEHHQRFFPVRGEDGTLEAAFVAVLDREPSSHDVARRGFERVLVPRLHDASFFLSEDRKQRLEDRLSALEGVVYHRKLGTLREKAARLAKTARVVAELMGLDRDGVDRSVRAAELAKCDLVTLMVGEFPELQGHVGSVYAAGDGEHADVAEAIDWQYRHDFDGAGRPSDVAVAVVLAENLDTLTAFGTQVGLPTGSADPFGVRRAAITFLAACERFAPDFPLYDGVASAGGDEKVREYLHARMVRRLRDRGVPHDHVDAVSTYASVGALVARLDDLAALSEAPGFDRLIEVAERCRNITKKSDAPASDVPGSEVREDLLAEDAEKALYAAWQPLAASLPAAPTALSRDDAVRIAATLGAPLHRFFEEVFVNADDAALRTNRHALLREIDATLLRFADLCRIVRPR